MIPFDPILYRQLPVIQKIIDDETWLEGERRGCWVSSSDPVVRENVCLVILRIGEQLRESCREPSALASDDMGAIPSFSAIDKAA